MRVKCIANRPTDQQERQLGKYFRAGKTIYLVEIGQEYVVLGLGFWDGVVWCDIAASPRIVVSVPTFFFEVLDGKPSRHWNIRIQQDGSVTLWPQAFRHEFFHDDLSDGRPEAVETFEYLYRLLEAEANS